MCFGENCDYVLAVLRLYNAGRSGRLLAVITASNSDLIVCDVDLNYTQMASGTPTILCLYSVVGHLLFKALFWL